MNNNMSNSSFAPVVLFVYNRVDHLQQTYEALLQCEEVKDTPLYIYSDAPKNDSVKSGVEEVRNYIEHIKNENKFKEIQVIHSQINKGLAQSIITGISEVIKTHGKVIVLEDDCVPSLYFLSFINDCLLKYEDDMSIGSIAGYSPPLKFANDYNLDIFLARRSCSWGWATWENRWCDVDWNMKYANQFIKNRNLINRLNSNGSDRFIRYYRQTKGNGSSWSIRFGAHHALKDWWVIYPRYSYIQNIGCDESGVHSRKEDAEKVQVNLEKAIKHPVIDKPEIRMDIQKNMKDFYSGGIISDAKRFIVTVLICMKGRFNL